MGDILKDYVVERRTRLLSLLGYFFLYVYSGRLYCILS